MNAIRWKPSQEGYTSSHCERYAISPQYWGRCNATSYKLEYCNSSGQRERIASEDTQKACKERAQKHADNAK